jgi:hypothetical protein
VGPGAWPEPGPGPEPEPGRGGHGPLSRPLRGARRARACRACHARRARHVRRACHAPCPVPAVRVVCVVRDVPDVLGEPLVEGLGAAGPRPGREVAAALHGLSDGAGGRDRHQQPASALGPQQLACHVDEFLDPRPGELRRHALGRPEDEPHEMLGDLAGRHRLRTHPGHHRDRARHPVEDLLRELQELRGAQHRPRRRALLGHDLLLPQLPPVVAEADPFEADDRQEYVVPYADPGARAQEVPADALEERDRLLGAHGLQVADVDDGLHARHGGVESGARDEVHTARPGQYHRFVPGGDQLVDHVPPDQPGPARYRDPHDGPPSSTVFLSTESLSVLSLSILIPYVIMCPLAARGAPARGEGRTTAPARSAGRR